MKLRPILYLKRNNYFSIAFSFSFLFLFNLSFAQQSTNPKSFFSKYQEDLSWVSLSENTTLSSDQFFDQTHAVFGLENARSMKTATVDTDKLGWTHHKYHQYFEDIKVEGGTYILHEKNGLVQKANGWVYPNVQVSTQAAFSPEKAIELGLEYHPAEKYLWQNPSAERVLKNARNDQEATYYPEASLVVVDRSYPKISHQMALAYKMEIQCAKPMARYIVYIDAQNGELIQSYNNLHPTHTDHSTHADHTEDEIIDGTAETRYSGTQTISTELDTTDGLYTLRDETRGVLIETLNSQDDYDIIPFYDDDNYWNNVNTQKDEVATDAHYGAAATYDFYKNHFDRDSYNDNGAALVSLVHVGDDWNNASWNGDVMSYGDGDGFLFHPLTAIDVCGHELTHAVTEYSAGLEYAFESGALNESFSDIFGKAIEFEYAPDDFDWLIGGKIMVMTGNSIRTMQDPNLRGDPKFYQGAFWHIEQTDNGGVHTNSGVQNYWYYLLVEGGQGVAENGYAYDIQGLGWEKAIEVAYRNLTVYLTQNSTYEDAREGSLEAAKDLYGYCSDEYLTIAKAWAAVGVGYEIQDGDFLMEAEDNIGTECDVEEVEVAIAISNIGCTTILTAGTAIPVSYQLDGKNPVNENFILAEDLLPGTSINYTFHQKADVAEYGEHTIRIQASPPGDIVEINNRKELTFTSRPYQNEDYALLTLVDPGGVCREEPQKDLIAIAAYLGCDTIAPGLLPFEYTFKSLIRNDQANTFVQQVPFTQTFLEGGFYFNEYGFDEGVFRLTYPGDPNPTNDSGNFYIARLRHHEIGWREDFAISSLDSAHLGIYREDNARCQIQGTDEYAYYMTGSEILGDFDHLKINIYDDADLFMRNNASFVTTMDICIDVKNMKTPYLIFDHAQTRSNFNFDAFGIKQEFSAMLGVFIDGRQIGSLIYGNNSNTNFTTYEYDLSAYKDGPHHLQIKSLGLISSMDSDGTILDDGDNNIIDYIEIIDQFGVSTKDAEPLTQLKVSPNPSTGSFYLRYQDGQSLSKTSIEVYDAAGKLHYTEGITSADQHHEFGADLIPGIYFVRVIDGDEVGVLKIVKQ